MVKRSYDVEHGFMCYVDFQILLVRGTEFVVELHDCLYTSLQLYCRRYCFLLIR